MIREKDTGLAHSRFNYKALQSHVSRGTLPGKADRQLLKLPQANGKLSEVPIGDGSQEQFWFRGR